MLTQASHFLFFCIWVGFIFSLGLLPPLHFRHLQCCLIKQLALNKGSYDGLVSPITSKERTSMVDFQYPLGEGESNTLYNLPDDHIIGPVKTALGCRMRSSQERSLRINALEPKQPFLRSDSIIPQTQDKYDDKVAIGHYNRGHIKNKWNTRSPDLMALAVELWTWCLSGDIYIQVEHLPGVQNCLADKASRTCIDSSESKI